MGFFLRGISHRTELPSLTSAMEYHGILSAATQEPARRLAPIDDTKLGLCHCLPEKQSWFKENFQLYFGNISNLQTEPTQALSQA